MLTAFIYFAKHVFPETANKNPHGILIAKLRLKNEIKLISVLRKWKGCLHDSLLASYVYLLPPSMPCFCLIWAICFPVCQHECVSLLVRVFSWHFSASVLAFHRSLKHTFTQVFCCFPWWNFRIQAQIGLYQRIRTGLILGLRGHLNQFVCISS